METLTGGLMQAVTDKQGLLSRFESKKAAHFGILWLFGEAQYLMSQLHFSTSMKCSVETLMTKTEPVVIDKDQLKTRNGLLLLALFRFFGFFRFWRKSQNPWVFAGMILVYGRALDSDLDWKSQGCAFWILWIWRVWISRFLWSFWTSRSMTPHRSKRMVFS